MTPVAPLIDNMITIATNTLRDDSSFSANRKWNPIIFLNPTYQNPTKKKNLKWHTYNFFTAKAEKQ